MIELVTFSDQTKRRVDNKTSTDIMPMCVMEDYLDVGLNCIVNICD